MKSLSDKFSYLLKLFSLYVIVLFASYASVAAFFNVTDCIWSTAYMN